MKPSLLKLQKIFKLEAERGYDNHAVVGGLERMIDVWEAEARIDGVPEDLIKYIGSRFHDYTRLSVKSRAETLQGLWRRIQRSESPDSEEAFEDLEPDLTPAIIKVSAVPIDPLAGDSKGLLSPIVDTTPPLVTSAELATSIAPEPTHIPPPKKTITPSIEPKALDAPVTVLQGVGPRIAQNLSRLGLNTFDRAKSAGRASHRSSRCRPEDRTKPQPAWIEYLAGHALSFPKAV
jgi:ATP-dependent DNA helicase RecG